LTHARQRNKTTLCPLRVVLNMRAALIALLLISACGPKSEDAVTMDTSGLLVLVQDGTRLSSATSSEGVMPARGSLWSIDEMDASSRGVDITTDLVEVIGVFDATIDLTARVPITKFRISAALLTGDSVVRGGDYDLGPDGGTIWLTRIEPKPEGGYRVRGQFDGQSCPVSDVAENCHRIEGVFAFDQFDLPANALTGNLIPAI
jgi:hypothetical protein